MGRRNILKPFQVFTDADSATSPSGTSTDVSGLDNITYLIQAQNTVDCEMAVYVYRTDNKSDTPVPLDFGEQILIDGAVETDYTLKIENHGYKWMVLEFEANTGTGNVNAWVSGNSVGA